MTTFPDLTDDELLRYSRHILLPQIDVLGQQRIRNATVLVVGAGGLGSPILLYLAAAGVGELRIADGDRVDETNLQRQIVHSTASVGTAKTESAAATLQRLNPHCRLVEIDQPLDATGLEHWAEGCDLVVIGTDSFASRYDANAVCLRLGIPLVCGAAIGLNGQATSFDFRRDDSPCFACLYPDGEDTELSCSTAGVLGPLVGMVGTVQATEALKLLAGFGEPLVGQLLTVDATDLSWNRFRFARRPDCPVCASRPRTA
ncbi:HesA/MoeB/ThiF family protein [Saccharospirillum mangrovi]|uniref:HesA/MoeB/ThiF family protein n=1 Tax=Saccharospirillum mangrovi TaxID=2161747 RepID=UPI000D3A0E55|nr:molybdopterin-synthase adenylyltransferase MoeB [Saccharospirillum mangrovi]